MSKNKPVTAFYDGKCGICITAKNFTEKLDKRHNIRFVDLWESDELIKGTAIRKKDLAEEIHVIATKGEVYRGYYAIKYLVTNIFWLSPLKLLSKLPFSDFVGVNLYKILARNRLKLFTCKDCQAKR